jgi:hypothetical protein
VTPIERIQSALQSLGLKAVEARLEGLLDHASKNDPTYADFLDELLGCEVNARRSRWLESEGSSPTIRANSPRVDIGEASRPWRLRREHTHGLTPFHCPMTNSVPLFSV